MSVSVVGYRRFGVLNALDKNIAQLFTTLPVQLVGTLGGTEAAGMLTFALNLIRQTTFFTSALFENLQAVIPLAIGRGEYLKSWRNLLRVMLTLLIGSAGFYVAFALAVPYLMRWLGSEWVGAERVILWLSVFWDCLHSGRGFGSVVSRL
jgi:O-antigen/teichoic acid export membrane protein